MGAMHRPLSSALPSWRWWLAPRLYDWLVLLFAISIILNYGLLNRLHQLADLPRWDPIAALTDWRVSGLIVALLVLVAVERWAFWRYRDTPPAVASLVLLLVRAGLVEIVVQIEGFGIASFLYAIVPLSAALTFGGRASLVAGALIWLRYLVKCAEAYTVDWPSVVEELLLFTMAIIFVLILGRMMIKEQQARRRAEQFLVALEQSHRALETSHRQLAASAERVAELATAAERNRLAREIHDGLGHGLTAIAIQLEKALTYRERDSVEAEQAVQTAQHLAREALADVRRSVGLLRATGQTFSLATAIGALVEPLSPSLTIAVTIDGEAATYPLPIQMALYRAAQEALTNIQHHAQARRASIELVFTPTVASLQVSDDGIGGAGLEAGGPARRSGGGQGLQGLQERLALLGGTLTIDSPPGGGTMLTARLPLVAAAEPVVVAAAAVGE